MRGKYDGPGQFVSIAKEAPNPAFEKQRLKITGFFHEAVKSDVDMVLNRFWEYNFPPNWQVVIPLLTREQQVTLHSLD